MTYTIERVHSCVAELGQAMYRLTYESDYVPELHVWRHVLVHEEKLYPLAPDAQVSTLRLTDSLGARCRSGTIQGWVTHTLQHDSIPCDGSQGLPEQSVCGAARLLKS
jgi:hypothetical protein